MGRVQAQGAPQVREVGGVWPDWRRSRSLRVEEDRWGRCGWRWMWWSR